MSELYRQMRAFPQGRPPLGRNGKPAPGKRPLTASSSVSTL